MAPKYQNNDYGRPILLYPGISFRVGSMVLLKTAGKEVVNKAVDKVDKPSLTPKYKRVRQNCSKLRQQKASISR